MNDTLTLNHGAGWSCEPKSCWVDHQHRSYDLEQAGNDSKQDLLVGVPSSDLIVDAETQFKDTHAKKCVYREI